MRRHKHEEKRKQHTHNLLGSVGKFTHEKVLFGLIDFELEALNTFGWIYFLLWLLSVLVCFHWKIFECIFVYGVVCWPTQKRNYVDNVLVQVHIQKEYVEMPNRFSSTDNFCSQIKLFLFEKWFNYSRKQLL